MQEAFKNFQLETIPHPGSCWLKPMSMSGFRTKPGLVNKNTTTRARRGSRPELFEQQLVRLSHGAVCPATGTNGSLAQSSGKPEVMKQHLALIAFEQMPGRHAVVIMDGAGWHTMECADDSQSQLIKLLLILRTQSH